MQWFPVTSTSESLPRGFRSGLSDQWRATDIPPLGRVPAARVLRDWAHAALEYATEDQLRAILGLLQTSLHADSKALETRTSWIESPPRRGESYVPADEFAPAPDRVVETAAVQGVVAQVALGRIHFAEEINEPIPEDVLDRYGF